MDVFVPTSLTREIAKEIDLESQREDARYWKQPQENSERVQRLVGVLMLLGNPRDLTAVMEPTGESSGRLAGASPSTSPTCGLYSPTCTITPDISSILP